MWKDFREAFASKLTKGGRFEQITLYVSELETWITWHENAAQHRVQRTAIACSILGAFSGWVICRLVFGG